MSRLSVLFLLVIVTSHACTGVILRPNWFPYFRKTNQTAQRLRYSTDRLPENSGLRQTRSGVPFQADPKSINTMGRENDEVRLENPCRDGIDLLDCLVRVLSIVNRAVERD